VGGSGVPRMNRKIPKKRTILKGKKKKKKKKKKKGGDLLALPQEGHKTKLYMHHTPRASTCGGLRSNVRSV